MISKNRNVNIFDYDWISILIYVGLILIGILSIYSTDYFHLKENLFQNYFVKQIIWFAFSIILIIAIGFVPIKSIKENSSLLYLLGIFSLIIVLFIGAKINGNRSWFRIGSFGIQPAEFVKLTTVLGLAKLASDIDFNLKNVKNFLGALALIFTPILLILLQPDLGSAMVFASLLIVFYREGVDLKYFLYMFGIAFLFIATIYWGKNLMSVIAIFLTILINAIIFYFLKKNILLKSIIPLSISLFIIFSTHIVFNKILKPHQRNRIEIVLGKKKDNKGTGYNLRQALIAIGSGGILGNSLEMSTQTKGGYIPEQHTDWIFTVVGERWGFIGSLILIILYVLLLYRLIFLAERQKQKFSRILGYGVFSILLIHFTLNIFMVLGLFPTIGIPLPFISYGGSSLWAFTLMLFIFLKFDAHRKEDW